MLLSDLVQALGLQQERTQSVYRLMRILVHCGFFVKQSVSTTGRHDEEEEGEGYLLAPPSQLLLKEHPFSLRPYLLAFLDPILTDPWHDMDKWFQNNDVTPFHTTHGKSLYDLAGQEPELNQSFNEAMAFDSRLVVSVLLKNCGGVFQALDSIVDVGGGTGTVGKAIAEAFPDTHCIIFDLPHVVNGLVGSKNLTYVAGDMFEAIPNANAVFHKWTLHNWNDEECIKILKNCKEAIPSKESGGKLVIIDIVMKVDEGGDKLFETQLYFDMLMMSCFTGRQRSEKDWATLFLDGGFTDYKIILVLGFRSLIEVYPYLSYYFLCNVTS
ncbi:putative trans-resveratrol di-O-methyltransferase [Helianthus annuus]|nr:putative trans-resveratrol di-O-methyltransferase [Helianthus annuus]